MDPTEMKIYVAWDCLEGLSVQRILRKEHVGRTGLGFLRPAPPGRPEHTLSDRVPDDFRPSLWEELPSLGTVACRD